MPRYYLGVDGGQSSTVALIADETGEIIGRGSSGPCNHVFGAAAEEKFLRVVGVCLHQACSQAGLSSQDVEFAAACLGFSGGALDKESMAKRLIRSHRFRVTHDAEIALDGATGGVPGIIAIAGTGSMAFGRNAAQKSARAGGWGYLFGDEGGAYDLVRQALRAILRFEEGWGPATALRQQLVKATGATGANEVLHSFYGPDFPRSRIAQMAVLVNDAAEDGDVVASEILIEGAKALVGYVTGVFAQLFEASERAMVCPIGGVFRSAALKTAFVQQVAEQLHCPVQEPLYPPAAGAVLGALRLDGNQSSLRGVRSGLK